MYEREGTRFTYVVPAQPDNELVRKVEEHRRKTGGEPVGYILATLDNSKGDRERWFPDLGVITDEDEPVMMSEARRVFAGWKEGASAAVYAEGVDLYNEFYSFGSALPGEKKVSLLASLAPLRPVKAVYILPGLAEVLEEGRPPLIELQKAGD